ncbi:hypothetical protein B0H12DRAFT_1131519 [Mycena haematopus]|nr:hypothetical protein B0H12DRAFT_1131519 [Mycena haematopus]
MLDAGRHFYPPPPDSARSMRATYARGEGVGVIPEIEAPGRAVEAGACSGWRI